MNRERSFIMLRTLVSMLVAILIAFFIILCISDDPIGSIKTFLLGPLSTKRYIGNIIETAIPLIFSGLSMAILFRTGLFNLGAEGVFFFSGLIASIVAIWPKLPPVVMPVLCILCAMIVGVVIMMVPGVLRAKYGANEMVTSLMMNNILLGVGMYILNNIVRDPSLSALVSYRYRENALLGIIISGTRVHSGLIIALICAAITYVFLFKSKWGYEIRLVGDNEKFAAYSGIKVSRVILVAHAVAGVLAGMGGIIECLGMHKRFEWTDLPGYGMDGAMIAMLGNNNPLGVIGAALFVSYLRVGADLVNRSSDVPMEMVSILQSIVILLISSEHFLHKYKQRWIEKEVKR